jgi:hypothetical protein
MDAFKQRAIIGKVREYFSRPDAVLAYEATFKYDEDSGQCVYRGNGDPASSVRCGIGSLVPDSEYDPEWEGEGVYGIWSDLHRILDLDVHDESARLWLSNLQAKHDDKARAGDSVTSFLAALHVFEQETVGA